MFIRPRNDAVKSFLAQSRTLGAIFGLAAFRNQAAQPLSCVNELAARSELVAYVPINAASSK
jgi:hypothetical protein